MNYLCILCHKKTILKKTTKTKKTDLYFGVFAAGVSVSRFDGGVPEHLLLLSFCMYHSLTFYLSTFFAVCGNEWSVCGPNAPDISTAEVGGARDCSDS